MNLLEKRLRMLGILGVISLLSYTAMVVFSPLAYPGYDWLSMAVSDLCAEGAPSAKLASQLNALFGPCGLVSVMAVCVGVAGAGKEQIKSLRIWAIVCLVAMMIGPIGTALLPKVVFGLFERFSTFSAVVFNAVLGIYLMKGRFTVVK